MTSPLFQAAWRTLQQSFRERATIRELGQQLSARRGGSTGMMRQVRSLMHETSGLSQQARSGRVSDFVRENIISEVLRQLGPVGELVGAMLRPQGESLTDRISDEMRGAMSLISWLDQAHTPVPARPNWLPRRQLQPATRSGSGGNGSRPPASPAAPSAPQPPPNQTPGRVNLQVFGRRYSVDDDDPIVTGAMIPVVSSNVHSIGYEWNYDNPAKGTLKVRFLEGKAKKSGTRAAGPLYDYFGVHPEVFMAFQQVASKGTFVWDRLRIRGTVTGHRFHYELEDLGSTNYVPRKATRLGPNEHFLKRQFTDRMTGRTHTSQLEDEFVQRLGNNRHGPQGIVPGRGTPRRGAPNRGRP